MFTPYAGISTMRIESDTNILGLYVLAPVVKRELAGYRERMRSGLE